MPAAAKTSGSFGILPALLDIAVHPLGGNHRIGLKQARPEPGRNVTQTKILAVDDDAMVQKGLRTSCHAGKVKNYILTAISRDFLP
jgi:hypothetical protein